MYRVNFEHYGTQYIGRDILKPDIVPCASDMCIYWPGRNLASARIPVIVPYSKASIELLLRPVTRSFSGPDSPRRYRDGGGASARASRFLAAGSGDFGFRLTQTPTLQLMPGHVDLFR